MAAIVFLSLGILVARALRYMEWSWSTVGMVMAVTSVLVHNLFDFSLEFFGMTFPVMTTLAILYRRTSPPKRYLKHTYMSHAPIVLSVLTFVAFLFVAPWISTHWYRNAEARVIRAMEEKNWVTIEHVVNEELSLHPTNYVLALGMGWSKFNQGHTAEGMRWMAHAVWLFPEHHMPHFLLARMLVRAGNPSQAASEYRQALIRGLNPTRSLVNEMRKGLGKNFWDAIPWDSLRSLVKIFPLLNNNEKYEACLRLVNDSKGHYFGCYARMVGDSLQKGLYVRALRYLEKWEKAMPDDVGPIAYRVALLLERHKTEKAMKILENKGERSHLAFMYVHALLLEKMGKKEEARRLLEKCLKWNVGAPYTKMLVLKKLMSMSDRVMRERYATYLISKKDKPSPSSAEKLIYSVLSKYVKTQ